jgi:hypothetical protein
MATWQQFSEEAPELAKAVRARFESAKHHVLATLRRDGSPRVSGTEVEFRGNDLVLGSMEGARKARDLQRDPRYALHANPGPDTSMTGGDAKVSGRAVEEVVPDGGSHLFRLELDEAVLTSVDQGRGLLIIQSWRPGQPLRRSERT